MSDDNSEHENNDGQEDRPDFNSVLHADGENSASRPRGISHPSAVLLFLIASVLGGAIGWIGPSLLGDKADMVSVERFDALSIRLDEQEKTISTLQDGQTKQAARLRLVTSAQKEMGATISTMSQNLDDTTNTNAPEPNDVIPNPDIADITQRLARLEANQMLDPVGTPEDVPDRSALTDRLVLIDTQQTEIETLKQAAQALGARVDTLENDVVLINTERQNQAKITAPTTQNPKARAALIASFPLSALQDAAAMQTAKPKKGFLARSLSRHVKVIDGQDPLLTIKAAEAKLAAGDIAGTIAMLDTLDPAIGIAAQDWIQQARRLDTQ